MNSMKVQVMYLCTAIILVTIIKCNKHYELQYFGVYELKTMIISTLVLYTCWSVC